jgi:hypothetical protein
MKEELFEASNVKVLNHPYKWLKLDSNISNLSGEFHN